MAWTWRLEQPDGTEVTGADNVDNPQHANQSDAESWLGESFGELAESGVAQVTLFEGETKVYGPMSLAAE